MKTRLATRIAILLLMVGVGTACSDTQPVAVEYYQPAYRTTPPEPVYNRLMWSHLPKPIAPKTAEVAPALLPEVEFDMPDAKLGEAIEALAQTMGYRWHYPNKVAGRQIKIRMEGTVEDVLKEIGRQGNVYAQFDHEHRLIVVMDSDMVPRLPGS
ncbi:MAG: hypothetical protein KDD69_00875 [Bdellovibrionales bacterium]|nr:hypothetical protein [Bdellovibrionales bacterium]